MATKQKKVEACKNCGVCPTCGQKANPIFIPYPVYVYPYVWPQPYTVPYPYGWPSITISTSDDGNCGGVREPINTNGPILTSGSNFSLNTSITFNSNMN